MQTIEKHFFELLQWLIHKQEKIGPLREEKLQAREAK
jgi:hypothetical protein